MQPETTTKDRFSLLDNVSVWNIVALVLLFFFGAEEVGTLIVVRVIPILLHFSNATTNNYIDSFTGEFLLIMFSYPIVALALYRLLLYKDQKAKQLVGLNRTNNHKFGWLVLAYVGYIFISVVVIDILTKLIPAVKSNEYYKQQLGLSTVHSGSIMEILAIIGLSIIDPIVEELVFRGFIFGSLNKKYSFIWAATITSVIFALPHMIENDHAILYVTGISIFIFSYILCWLRKKTGNIYMGMVMHGASNLLALVALVHGL